MIESIKGFQTNEGTKQYDYNALANKPILIELDTTLSVEGKAADAKAVGDAISKLSGGSTELVLSDNLFDKSTAVLGKAFYHSSSGTQLIDSSGRYYAYVELRGAGIYRTKVDVALHSEDYAKRVPLLKADKTWIRNITGTISDTGDRTAQDLEFIVTQDMIDEGAVYYPLTIHKNNIDTVMMVKDRDYPTVYIPYGYIEVKTENDTSNLQTNVLCGKTAVFFGDSLCAGTTVGDTAPEYGWGWAGLIGNANTMTWKNYGRNGGTITDLADVDNIRWLSYQADLAILQYPNADYVIIQGGSNDADKMKESGLGVISSDYSSFDTTTFTGALESLLKKLIEAYPKAKIGYIIATKIYVKNSHTAENSIQRKYFDRAIEVCNKWGIPVIDLWNSSPLNPNLETASIFYTDGQHLTLDGYKAIVPQIEAWMRNFNTSGVVPNSVLASGGNVDLTDYTELLPESTYEIAEGTDTVRLDRNLTFIAEKTYLVKWNGVDYVRVAHTYVYEDDETVIVGEDGDPFVIEDYGNDMDIFTLDGSTNVVLAIYQKAEYATKEWVEEKLEEYSSLAGERGFGFLYYSGSNLNEMEDFISLEDLEKPYGYTPQIGDLVLCADGYVFEIVALSLDTGAEVASTGICLAGTSVTHSWNNTTLTITSASGTSSVDLKGDKGDTPIKGTDYFTQSEINSIIAAAASQVLAQFTDVSKVGA